MKLAFLGSFLLFGITLDRFILRAVLVLGSFLPLCFLFINLNENPRYPLSSTYGLTLSRTVSDEIRALSRKPWIFVCVKGDVDVKQADFRFLFIKQTF